MKKKVISILLSVIMIVGVLPFSAAPVFAEESAPQEPVPFVYYNEELKDFSQSVAPHYKSVTSSDVEWRDGVYVAKGNITIDNRIRVNGNVYLILTDGCELTVNGGINVDSAESFVILAQSAGSGKLTANGTEQVSGIGGRSGGKTVSIHGGIISATGGYEAAGIGSDYEGTGCNVNIYGGRVNACGGARGAGIGSGSRGTAGSLNIYGGSVIASSPQQAAGINGTTTIFGGTVEANGQFSSGINGILKIYGGLVFSHGHPFSEPSIGCDSIEVSEDIQLVNLNDGTYITKNEGQEWTDVFTDSNCSFAAQKPDEKVPYLAYDTKTGKYAENECKDYQILNKSMGYLTSGWYVAKGNMVFDSRIIIFGNVNLILADECNLTANEGINVSAGNSLSIFGQSDRLDAGTLTASYTHYSSNAAIGGNGNSGTINIHGGNIIADGSAYGAGIGGGEDGNGTVNIYGGTVTATGGGSGAGIGGGDRGSSSVNIYGGNITAIGGANAAGIGGGFFADGGNVSIYGGNIYANGGSNHNGVGSVNAVGGGENAGINSLTIAENLSLYNNETGEQVDSISELGSVSIIDPTIGTESFKVDYLKYNNGTFSAETSEKDAYAPCPFFPTWDYDWYVIDDDITLNDITVSGNVNLVLKDNCTLTADSITVPNGSSLTIYAQSEGENMGKIICAGGIVTEKNAALNIHGGDITAKAEYSNNAAIGSRTEEACGNITIYGGKIYAEGSEYGGAGIGNGYYSIGFDYDDLDDACYIYDKGTTGTITIYGGDITAIGHGFAAGIGGGYGCDSGNITIYGGKVNATGGETTYYDYHGYQADGIGSGYLEVLDDYDCEVIYAQPVEGGTVNVYGGEVYSNGQKITPKHLHILKKIETKEATCAETGISTAYYVCDWENGCGKYFADESAVTELTAEQVAGYVISAKGHDFTSGIFKNNEDGTHSQKCTKCDEYGAIEYHTFVDGVCVCGACIITEKNGAVSENGYIYGLEPNLTSLTDYIDVAEGYDLTYSTNKIGTGTAINAVKDNVTYASCTAVIFGDVNGDGWYDGTDSIIVNCLANGMLTEDDVSEAEYMAADCNHDGVIDQLDVDILQQAGVLLTDVDQTKSEEELIATSSAYVEYLNLIDQTVETETTEVVEDEPVDPGYAFNFFDMILNLIKEIITVINSVIAFFK